MTVFRSEGWVVRPSFVPHGPTSPVTLLGDEVGLTQLTGTPAVAWQTPWGELANVQLVRFARGLALFATANGVRYCWRTTNKANYEQIAGVISQHGGRVVRRRRRAGIYVVVLVVLLASVAGGIGAFFDKGSASAAIIANTEAVNLSVRDLPSGWSPASGFVVERLVQLAGHGPDLDHGHHRTREELHLGQGLDVVPTLPRGLGQQGPHVRPLGTRTRLSGRLTGLRF